MACLQIGLKGRHLHIEIWSCQPSSNAADRLAGFVLRGFGAWRPPYLKKADRTSECAPNRLVLRAFLLDRLGPDRYALRQEEMSWRLSGV